MVSEIYSKSDEQAARRFFGYALRHDPAELGELYSDRRTPEDFACAVRDHLMAEEWVKNNSDSVFDSASGAFKSGLKTVATITDYLSSKMPPQLVLPTLRDPASVHAIIALSHQTRSDFRKTMQRFVDQGEDHASSSPLEPSVSDTGNFIVTSPDIPVYSEETGCPFTAGQKTSISPIVRRAILWWSESSVSGRVVGTLENQPENTTPFAKPQSGQA